MPPAASTFTLGLVQLRCEKAPDSNLERALSAVRRAAHAGAQIVCLPELFSLPYFAHQQDEDAFDFAEAVPGPTTERLSEAAKQAGVVLVGSIFERRAAGLYHSTAVVFDTNGALLGAYRRMHLADRPGAVEKFYFTPGDLGFRSLNTRFGRIGLLLSWDQWFPEAARLLALHGAEVLLGLSAFGRSLDEDDSEREAWELTQRSHAITNGVYVASVNRVGHEGDEDGLTFWGSSFVSDPMGRVHGQASAEREEVVVVPCDRRQLEQVRRAWPFFRDRRPEAYAKLGRRWLR